MVWGNVDLEVEGVDLGEIRLKEVKGEYWGVLEGFGLLGVEVLVGWYWMRTMRREVVLWAGQMGKEVYWDKEKV